MNVAVVGASNKEHRYSYMAFKLLKEKGHVVYPVHQRIKDIEGDKVFGSLSEIVDEIDTITMYVGSDISNSISDQLLSIKPKRVIFNPGAENTELSEKLRNEGIESVEACTLVMLKTDQF